MDGPANFPPRKGPRPTPPAGGPSKSPVPFARPARLGGTGALGGTGPLHAPEPSPSQDRPTVVRLDPNGKPGEFNFVIDGQAEARVAQAPSSGLTAEASGGIPLELHRAVDEVLAFIYALDQQVESRRKPLKP